MPRKQAWLAETQLSYKPTQTLIHQPSIRCSEDAYQLFLASWNPDTLELYEQFKVMLLSRANNVLGIVSISSGGVSDTEVDPKLVFAAALKANASSLVLCHNHPSGNPEPSVSDLELTQRLDQAAHLLDLKLLDHLILTRQGYYSMADEGRL
ncbi:MAG TPA: JAB domain-containing protein [Chitinophagaceae bacterium]|nr:JAB domain-containing protein [Chitinophagaceae bacterium]